MRLTTRIAGLGVGLGLLLAAGCDDPEVEEAGREIGDAAAATGDALDDMAAEGADATGKAMERAGRGLQDAADGGR